MKGINSSLVGRDVKFGERFEQDGKIVAVGMCETQMVVFIEDEQGKVSQGSIDNFKLVTKKSCSPQYSTW